MITRRFSASMGAEEASRQSITARKSASDLALALATVLVHLLITITGPGDQDPVQQFHGARYHCGHIRERRGIQHLAYRGAFAVVDQAKAEKLLLRPAAGVKFHRQRDKLEQGDHGKNPHRDPSELRQAKQK